MRKILQRTKKNEEFINSLPKISLVYRIAGFSCVELPLAKWVKEDDYMIPYVYLYDDHNGTTDQYELRPIYWYTTFTIIGWFESKQMAQKVCDALQKSNNKMESF